MNSWNTWPRDWRRQGQHLRRRRMSTPTVDESLPRSSNQETKSGWMEVISLPTDHRLDCPTNIQAPLLSKCASGEVHITLPSPPTSAAFTPCSWWSNCLSRIQIRSRANILCHPHPQLLSMARRSMRSRQYWIAEYITTAWSTYSSSRVMTRVTINGMFTHMSIQSQR
jgi:hypothetical protein